MRVLVLSTGSLLRGWSECYWWGEGPDVAERFSKSSLARFHPFLISIVREMVQKGPGWRGGDTPKVWGDPWVVAVGDYPLPQHALITYDAKEGGGGWVCHDKEVVALAAWRVGVKKVARRNNLNAEELIKWLEREDGWPISVTWEIDGQRQRVRVAPIVKRFF